MARNEVARNRRLAKLAARKYGLPVDLFLRQIKLESGFRNLGANSAGAVGVAQIVPKWHPGVNPSNPRQALMYAARLMKSHYKKYGSWRDALSAYNSGQPWSHGSGIEETRNYVRIILGNRKYGAPGKQNKNVKLGGGGPKGGPKGTPAQPSQTIPGLNIPAFTSGIDPRRREILSGVFETVGLPDIFSGRSFELPGIRIPDMVIPGTPGRVRPGKNPQPGQRQPTVHGGKQGFKGKRSVYVDPANFTSTHETSGLGGYPAYDYMSPPGTIVRIKEPVQVYRHSGRSPSQGGPAGGAMGYSLYAKGLRTGNDYYITHLSKTAKLGRYKAGAGIGVVAYGPPSWSSPHAHVGVKRGKKRRRR